MALLPLVGRVPGGRCGNGNWFAWNVYIEPGENHWHGAAPARFHTQIAYQEADETGSHTTWGRRLTEQECPG